MDFASYFAGGMWFFTLFWGFFGGPILELFFLQSEKENRRRIGLVTLRVHCAVVSILLALLFIASISSGDKNGLGIFTGLAFLMVLVPYTFHAYPQNFGNFMFTSIGEKRWNTQSISFAKKVLLVYVVFIALVWIIKYWKPLVTLNLPL